MTEDRQVRNEEKESLRHIIQQWNSNRLDLFEISEPDENLEFHGVMRFYFQDSGQKVATKCIRVSSNANTRHVIETLIEKFRPDMRMLSIPEYTLYEIHENGEERRLSEDEKPLLVQLNWNKDDREGRFLLRRMDLNGVMKMKTLPPVLTASQPPAAEETFIRRLSRREKKELKKQEKIRRANENDDSNSMAEKLYTELPETSFTRSISNPEAVMQRRRAQKLEKKLQQFRSKDGGPDTGGTLKIYGESLCQDVPYKTLLLSVRDSSASVVKEMLEKYGLYREDPTSYCLVQCIVTPEETVDGYQGKIIPQKEYILDDDECPLAILMNHPPSRGSIMFQVRRRPADHGQRRRKKKPLKGAGMAEAHNLPQRHPMEDVLPFLVELGPDLSEIGKGRHHQLHLNVTEVGSDRSSHTGVQSLQLFGPHIQPRHCVIAHTDGIVTVTPCSRGAETYVNFQRIYETTILQNGSIVRFGRSHTFRFMDPQHDDRLRMHLSSPQPVHHHPQYMDRSGQGQEGTGKSEGPPPGSLAGSQFGSRGSSIGGSQTSIAARPPFRAGSEMTLVRPPQQGGQEPWNNYERFVPPRDPILPAVLEFREEAEDPFIHNITTQLDPTDIQLKLAPTYTLYMAARFRASTHYRPDLSPTERAQKLTIMLTKVASIVHDVIEFKQRDPTALSFWMANASELLHFLKQDRHICGYSLDAQDILAEAVQFAFKKLVEYMQTELSSAMPVFLEDRDDRDEEEGTTAHVLSLLTNTMALLRRCRVNAALTIQLFSQLFHYINMWVFNKVVMENCPNYCSRVWGERIKERLGRIELWAEKQGLELSADCHLAKLSQAALLLIAPKSSPEDAANLSSTCFKLNSLQLRELLEKYQPAPGEPSVPKELIDNVVSVAETTADGLAREDGRDVRLEEVGDLQLPFLLPQDGYSCDIVRGVPSGLPEFLEPFERAQLCRMTPQPTSSGFWTIYMHNHQELQGQRHPPGPRSPSAMSNRSITVPRGEPEIHTIELQKFNNGMGLSIVATKGENQAQLGIYIKSVVPGGAADQDGRLQAGDQLLSVDGKSLVGISQEEAAQYMVGTGSVVTLEVARQGALYHGLAPLLSQPSPQVTRGIQDPRREPPQHTQSHIQPQPPSHMPSHHPPQQQPHFSHHGQQPRMQSSKSVPALNSDFHHSATKSNSHEVFNPAYSRTSSSTSLTQHQQQPQQQHPHSHQQYPVRSRSTQNLNESSALTLTGRHPSSPALNTEDDRHYQNISFHQGAQDPRMGSQRGGRPPIFPPQSPSGGQDQPRPTSAFMHREDVSMGRGEPLHRPTSQQNLRPDMRYGNEDPRKRPNGLPLSQQVTHMGPGYPPNQNQGMPMNNAPVQRQQYPRGHPKYNYQYGGGPPPQMSPLAHPGQMSPQGYFAPTSAGSPQGIPPQPMSPQYANSPQNSTLSARHPPPTAPKPNRNSGSFGPDTGPEKPMRQSSVEGPPGKPNGPLRPTLPEDGYRDSPPPPPPPTSTHPLMQSVSRGVPPPGNPGMFGKQVGGIKGPWDRDEKEKYETRKREAARRWRDEQISALENLGSKTPQEEERMNTLKLEREFQRRAEERLHEDDDEDEDEEEDDDDDMDLPKAEIVPPSSSSRPPNGNLGEAQEEDRDKRADEIRRKQRELEAAKEAEERILREAQRRQEEELLRRHHQQQQQQRHQTQATQRLDSLVGAPLNANGTMGNSPRQNYMDHHPPSISPLPPERGSSYSVMHHHQTLETRHSDSAHNRGRPQEAAPVKRVQFSETSPVDTHITYDNNANHEKVSTREDPDDFINEAELMMLSTSPNRGTGNTPGVIGAQEVYRDPRQRRLMEQAQKAAASRGPGPEKLTFREKMKMFAMEAEEGESPKDKMKHSRAQRDIDS